MSRIMWIGLAGLATIGGIAYHNQDEIEHAVVMADYAIGENRAEFLAEMEALEAKIESGEVSEDDAVEEAIERLIERASGVDPDDENDTPSISITYGNDRSGPGRSFDQAIRETRERLDRIEQRVVELHSEGRLSDAEFERAIADLDMAQGKVAELRREGPAEDVRAEIEEARDEAREAVEEARAVVEESRRAARRDLQELRDDIRQ